MSLVGFESEIFDKSCKFSSTSKNNILKKMFLVSRKYYLVGCGFANHRQFLASFYKIRYHPKDFGAQGRHQRIVNELFNLHHSSLRNVVERIFSIFRSRFTIFKVTPSFLFQI